jgi:hypothetical protein
MIMFDNIPITEEKFLQPCYRISPFTTSSLRFNKLLTEKNLVSSDKKLRGFNKEYIFTRSGKDALFKAISTYQLVRNDIITIYTTSGNKYISKCVTDQIEKFCSWSREILKETKLLIVIHEFGFPYEDMEQLRSHKIPIIEDCAYSFFSQNDQNNVGTVGDFVIYSLPKIFPVNFGGILASNIESNISSLSDLSVDESKYLLSVTNHYIRKKEEIVKKRRFNYNYLSKSLYLFGFSSRFNLSSKNCPGVYMFECNSLNLNNLKTYFQSHGVESSVFYGENAFFLPVHQELSVTDLDYFLLLISSYVNENNKTHE